MDQNSLQCIPKLLYLLGSNADEVATKLVSLGIKGNNKEYRDNPIYNYLASKGVAVDLAWGFGGLGGGIAVGTVDYKYYYLTDYPKLQGTVDYKYYYLTDYPKLQGVKNFLYGFFYENKYTGLLDKRKI